MSVPSDHISDKGPSKLELDSHSLDKSSALRVENAATQHGNLSIGNVLKGTADKDLTLFERKAALVNA